MIELAYIIGFAMAVVNAFKRSIPERFSAFVPFIALFIAIVCNIINALLFGGDILIAGRDAFISAGIVVGMFAAGDAAGKSIKGIS
jgi:hypothetical protein